MIPLWFHLYKMLEDVNKSLVTQSISVVDWYWTGWEEGRFMKKHKQTLGDGRRVHCLDYGDGSTDGDICQNLSNYIL